MLVYILNANVNEKGHQSANYCPCPSEVYAYIFSFILYLLFFFFCISLEFIYVFWKENLICIIKVLLWKTVKNFNRV